MIFKVFDHSLYELEYLSAFTIPNTMLGLWRHWRGGLYLVTATARHESTQEIMYVYHAMSSDVTIAGRVFTRPSCEFTELVADTDNKWQPRFVFLHNPWNEPIVPRSAA